MKRTKTVVKKGLKKLTKANKILSNENVTKIFDWIAKSGIVLHKDLHGIVKVNPPTLSKYLSRLDAADLILLNQPRPKGLDRYVRYERRMGFIKISPYGRKLSKIMGSPTPLQIARVASDMNRIWVLETIAEKPKSYDEIFWDVNDLLKKYDMPRISSANLAYHIKKLKKRAQITPKSPFGLTSEGELTVKVIEDIVAYPIYIK